MCAATDRIGALIHEGHAENPPEWVEWDLTGKLVSRTLLQGIPWGGRAFTAGGRLYEGRAWTFQDVTEERFGTHVARGEVLALERGTGASATWGLLILSLAPGFVADGRLRAALVAGDADTVLEISAEVERLVERPLRLRLPDPDPPLLHGHEDSFARAGRIASEGTLHLFGRGLGPGDEYAVAGPPGTLVFADPPRRMAWPEG